VFDLEELDFDEVVEGFDICLPGVGAGGDCSVALPGDPKRERVIKWTRRRNLLAGFEPTHTGWF